MHGALTDSSELLDTIPLAKVALRVSVKRGQPALGKAEPYCSTNGNKVLSKCSAKCRWAVIIAFCNNRDFI